MNSLLKAAVSFLQWDQGSISTRELRKRYISPALGDDDDSHSQDERAGSRGPAHRAGVYLPRRTTVRTAARKQAAPYTRRATPTVDLPPSAPEDTAKKLREAEVKVERLQEAEEKLRKRLWEKELLLLNKDRDMEAKIALSADKLANERVAEVQNAANAWVAQVQEETEALRMSLRQSERSRLSAEARAELYRLRAQEAQEGLLQAQKRAEEAENKLYAERTARRREEQEKQEAQWRREAKRQQEERQEEWRRARDERRRAREEKRRAEEAKRVEEEQRQKIEAIKLYKFRWEYLKGYPNVEHKYHGIPFENFPWPVFASSPSAEDLTKDAISAFLFDELWKKVDKEDKEDGTSTLEPPKSEKSKKELVMDAIRRFHPDKNTRIQELLDEKDCEAIKASLHTVTCFLNELKAEV